MKIKLGDTAPPLVVNMNANLTGATAQVKFRRVHDDVVLTRNLAVTDPGNGIAEYVWQVGDLDTPGTYLVEAVVTFAGGEVQTFPQGSYLEVLVLPEVG